MDSEKKNLIAQIFWIVIVGIVVFFAYDIYNERNSRQDAESKSEVISEMCQKRAIAEANKFEEGQEKLAESNNPYLVGLTDEIPQMKEKFRNKEYAECMDIWGN